MANIALDNPVATAVGKGNCASLPLEGQLPWRTAVRSIVGFWAFYFIINTIRMAAMEAQNQFGMLERRVFVSVVGMLLTGLLCLLLRWVDRKPGRPIVTIAFLASLPVSFAYATANYTAFYVVHPMESDLQE